MTDDYVFDDARFGQDDMASRLWLAELAKDDVRREILSIVSNTWTADQITQNIDGVTNPDEVPGELESPLNVNARVQGSIDFGASAEIHEEQLIAYAEWLDDNPWGEKLDNQLTSVDKDHEASKGAAKSRLQEYS